MSPYFEAIKVSQRLYDRKKIDDGCISQSFADVPFTHGGIETQSFLEASDGLVKMFGRISSLLSFRPNTHPSSYLLPDLFSSGVFGFVQADIRSNINVR